MNREHAAKLPASDLFFTVNENHMAVQVRHFGMMRLLTILSSDLGRRCVSYPVGLTTCQAKFAMAISADLLLSNMRRCGWKAVRLAMNPTARPIRAC